MKNQIIKDIFFKLLINIFFWGSLPMYSLTYQDTVPLDPGIRYGKLPNGFTYYIKSINTASKEIDMRLIVKAGFNQEDPDQYEFAHFMEHIALKAGKHISTKMLYGSQMFNQLGIKPNAINALTSREYTEFRFILPDQSDKVQTVAFRLFQDIIWGLEFKPIYIDSERSPFLDESEFRGGKTSITSMDHILDSRIMGCGGKFPKHYAHHINTFEYKRLIRFYNDWYRPDLMALVIMGDIKNINGLENEIKKKFSASKTTRKPRPRLDCNENYLNGDTRFVRQEREILPQENTTEPVFLRLYMREGKKREKGTLEGLKNGLKRDLFIKMLNNRYTQMRWSYNSHFDIYSEFSEYPSAFKINICAYGNQERLAIMEALKILKQVKTYGFTDTEFNKSKTDLFDSLKKMDTTALSYWREEFRNHFVYGEGLPQNKIDFLKRMLNDLSLEEINNFSGGSIKNMPEDIGLIAPTANMALSYTEKTIRNWIVEADTSKTIPYAEPVIPTSLMDPIKVAGLKHSDYKEVAADIPGGKKYLLSNGVKLIFNSFTPTPDILGGSESVLFQGFVSNGASCFSKKDYFSAINAPDIIKNSGVGGKDKFDIERYLSHQGFKQYVTPYIGYKESGIRGNTTTTLKDLETALQLVYLYFMQPNYNELAYGDWKMNAHKRYLNNVVQDDLITTVKNVFNDSLFLPKGSKRMEGVKHTDMQRAYSIYHKLFGNVQDFTFLFSGNFQDEGLLLLCRKYLGNLPYTTRNVECKQSLKGRENIPQEPFVKEFPARKNINNVRVRMVYVTLLDKTSLDWKEKTKLMLLSRFLEYSFLKHLRKDSEKGGPYVAFVSNDNNDGISEYNKFSIDFGCSPEDVDRLVIETKQIIENLKKSPGREIKLFKAVKKRLTPVSDVETNTKMLEKMYLHYKYGYPWVSISDVRDYMSSLSLEDLQESAQKWLAPDPFQFRMIPPKEIR